MQRWIARAFALLLLPAFGHPADAADGEFRPKSINLVVVFEAGGTYDLYGRLAAMHLGRFLPGNPAIVVRYMPGAGGMIGAVHLYAKAVQDGTEIGIVDRGIATNQVLHPDAALDPGHFNWIGSLSSYSGVMYVASKTGVKSAADLTRIPVIVGSWGPATSSYTMPVLLNALAGAQFKIITGYRGAADVDLAYENGEVEGRVASWVSLRAEKARWFAEGSVTLPFQTGIKRHPDLAGVPLFTDLAANPQDRRILEFVDSDSAVGWSLVAPPGVPADRVAILRRAFDAMVGDGEFRAEAAKRSLDVVPASGQEVEAVVKRTLAIPQDDVARMTRLLASQK
jgi:tripartite-type tricarboxylate transporter receptor subunit TctC